MTNQDIRNMDEKAFLDAYSEAKKGKQEEKNPINTAEFSFSQQVKRFNEFSFTREDIKEHHEDAMSA